jgi:hypothetical protein
LADSVCGDYHPVTAGMGNKASETLAKRIRSMRCGNLKPMRTKHAGWLTAGQLGLLVAAFLVAAGPAAAEISLSSRDTFSATSEGWRIGSNGTWPTQVSSLGPDGQVGYLSHFSDGGGSNGKWLMWNDGSQWQGNYPAAGVTGIDLWANVDSGTSPVSMRLAFGGPGGWFASDAQSVASGWSTYSFGLEEGNFSYVSGSGGTGTFADTIGGVTRFEVLAGAAPPSYQSGGFVQTGTSVNTILIDDIAAVPEPGGVAVVLAAGFVCYAMIGRGRWRR